MDSLLENLSQFEVSSYPNNPNAEHPHFSLYKNKRSTSSQEERRKKILEARKQSRYDFVKHLRQIEDVQENEEESNASENSMDVIENPVAVYARPRKYRNFIMLSEWLIEIPENFAESYVALPCPIGKRCLVVCYRGWTTAYSKSGARIRSFPSLLPGGSYKTKKKGYTVLDCIFSESKSTFYIIDLICWNKRSYIDCETNFRFNWLQNIINEWDEDISVIGNKNPFKFVSLPYFGCNNLCLEQMLNSELPFNEDLDGVLFYHKESHYTHGPSPLICWLKAYMFPEMLSVPVPNKYLTDRPSHYTNMSSHIEEYERERKEFILSKKAESKKKKGGGEGQMETTSSIEENTMK